MEGMSIAVHLTSLVAFITVGFFFIREQSRREFLLKLLLHYRGGGGVFLDDPYVFMKRLAVAFAIPYKMPSSGSPVMRRIAPDRIVDFLLHYRVSLIWRPQMSEDIRSDCELYLKASISDDRECERYEKEMSSALGIRISIQRMKEDIAGSK